MLYEILRPVSGCETPPGETVDFTNTVNARRLEQQGYIRRALVASDSQAKKGGK